jgi:hypothetical protein
MNKIANCVLALGAAVIANLVGVSPEADPIELTCLADTPCTGPQMVGLSPDGPENGTDPSAQPITQMVEQPAGGRFSFDIATAPIAWS